VPVAYDKRERGHGRTERRTLKVTAVARGLAFPHAAQAIQITRRRKVKGKWSREICYAATSLTITQASHAQLAAIIRGHWGIEDRLHWVRSLGVDFLLRDVAPECPTESSCNTSRGCSARCRCCSDAQPAQTCNKCNTSHSDGEESTTALPG
jgi:hypothetical protein